MTEPARDKSKQAPPPAPPKKEEQPRSKAPADRTAAGSVDKLAAGLASGAATGASDGQDQQHGRKLAYDPVVDFLDDVVGTRAHHEISIFALDDWTQGPRVRATLVGDPAIQLAQAPMYLQGMAVFDPRSVFKIDFVPKRAGLHEATLHVDIVDEPKQHLTITIRAWSREAGERTRAQTIAAEEQTRTDAANREAAAAARADAEKQIARHDQQAVHHHHAGNMRVLERKREQVEAKMLDLSDKRENGITFASGNIGEFKRVKPVPEQPSLLGQLAWSALDMVTAGVARNVSDFLRGPLERVLTTTVTERDIPYPISAQTVTPPSNALVGFIVEGVKSGVKQLGGAVAAKLKPGASEGGDPKHENGNNSGDAKAAFISAQTDAVTGDSHTNAATTARFVHDSLLDTLDVAPKTAFAVMDTMIGGLQAAFSNAIEEQRAETFRNWIRYLSQTSVGTSSKRKAEDGSGVTAIDNATRLDDEGAAKTFDGIVDVEIQIEEGNPLAPAIPKSAMIRGVANNVVETLRARPLAEARVPVRAVAGPSPRSATATLSVVRDEAGNLAYEDRVGGSETQPSRWLSRKAGIAVGSASGSDGAQREGARILMEKEVMARPLLRKLTTDSES